MAFITESLPPSVSPSTDSPIPRAPCFKSFRTSSIPDPAPAVDITNGLLHAHVKLDPSSEVFARQLFSVITALRVPGWDRTPTSPNSLSIRKESGALTNEVYFVSTLTSTSVPTLLLRIYGSSTNALFSRAHELHTLHVLSSRYHIGPHIYGTFTNGRIEEYFDSTTLSPADIRDKTISRWIGARMAEFHSISISAVEGPLAVSSQEGKSWEIGVEKNVKSWLQTARQVLAHPNLNEEDRIALNFDHFAHQWYRYMRWISRVEKSEGRSKRVFAHNDIHGGNLLKLKRRLPDGTPEHCQIVMVDFEYAAPNPRGFDIANYFQEWTTDYLSSTPHLMNPSLYPTLEERRRFYEAYLSHASSKPAIVGETSIVQLEREVRSWSPACSGMWAVWSIVQAKDDVERGMTGEEFNYIAHAKCRMAAFFRGFEELELGSFIHPV